MLRLEIECWNAKSENQTVLTLETIPKYNKQNKNKKHELKEVLILKKVQNP